MACPAREYRFHSLQVLDIEFANGVVMLDALDPVQAKLLDEVYSVGDQVSGQVTITVNASSIVVEDIEAEPWCRASRSVVTGVYCPAANSVVEWFSAGYAWVAIVAPEDELINRCLSLSVPLRLTLEPFPSLPQIIALQAFLLTYFSRSITLINLSVEFHSAFVVVADFLERTSGDVFSGADGAFLRLRRLDAFSHWESPLDCNQ
jgi:hypothetical protein